jgi:hypothetical protein
LSILTDILLIAIPLPIILGARLQLKQKLSLICLFGLGIASIGCSCARIVAILLDNSSISSTFWASAETMSAAIVCNAPVLRSLLGLHSKGETWSTQGTARSRSRKLSNLDGGVKDFGQKTRERFGNHSRVASRGGDRSKAGAIELSSYIDHEDGSEVELSKAPQETAKARESYSRDAKLSAASLSAFGGPIHITKEVQVDSETVRSDDDDHDDTNRRSMALSEQIQMRGPPRAKNFEKWMDSMKQSDASQRSHDR